ncbi:dTDP-4-dehydrorhamnose reductase [Corynebacterium lowii]|uniref:dTDP-4-dehydrorhamnose reductase n=1 Tax=Corynebacterium lowii TaxID=1544413 RepID=A0A0Q0YYT5_9CORY|nr:dTDP-4-dehydrorhamnose reductase [Corynebacterium lowii]KQB87533.1 dTDP-4-dehydrorhamnose reductase [Corynebacterium lowii]MDP9851872.1 dTDP-4-dehydrorhamnose reductase [Corynebacterium lowii]
MKVVVTGAAGQMGRCLRLCAPSWARVTWCDKRLLDVTSPRSVGQSPVLRGADVVINAAAFTAVDAAETHTPEATALNAQAPGLLARRCAEEGAHLIHLSTDYVFGTAAPRRPLLPGDAVAPDTVYGRTKAEGERAVVAAGGKHTVVRTAWLFSGNVLPEHRDFVSTMLRLADEGINPTVVSDQTGSPTFALDLARALWHVAAEETGRGMMHLAGTGQATWYELACATFEAAGHDPARVQPVSSEQYPTAAHRPPWSVLDSSPSGRSLELPEWRSGLDRAVRATLSAP